MSTAAIVRLITRQAERPSAIGHPLEFISDEHDRQLLIRGYLSDLLKTGRAGPLLEVAGPLLVFLTRDLPLHAEDEEVDLWRLLEERSLPEDGFAAVLARLDQEHGTEMFLSRHIVADLKAIAGGGIHRFPARLFTQLGLFSDGLSRHIAWENSVVLPLARNRLRAEDLKELGRGMAARRGLSTIDPGQ